MCDGYAAISAGIPKKRRWNEWSFLRLSLLAFAIVTTVYVTIPDYPSDIPAYTVLTLDPSGWLHEVFYIWTFCLVGINLSYIFEKKSNERV